MNHKRTDHTCVVGLAWGDEGKGKIVDLLCADFDVVVRFNGGANAGHTVCIGAEKFALHLLPVGVLREGITGVVGPGVVVDPVKLVEEIDAIEGRGIAVTPRLIVSDRAHVVMPHHKIEDRLREGGAGRIGTTARGIGPCYADKMLRAPAVRMVDLLDLDRHRQRILETIEHKAAAFRAVYGQDGGLDPVAAWDDLVRVAERLRPVIADASTWLLDAADEGRRLFFEGANGMLLDVDHGTYPFVTSSNTGPQGIAAGGGVPAALVGRSIGVTKAYTTRVGGGPFPTELKDATGDRIREAGHEYGTTTGRPRRCGWLDACAVRASVRLSGVTEIAVAHLDTLSGFPEVGICVAYELDGKSIRTLPADPEALERLVPVYEMRPGWKGDLRSVRRFEDLPQEARRFIERLETVVDAPVSIASVGPDREDTVFRDKSQ